MEGWRRLKEVRLQTTESNNTSSCAHMIPMVDMAILFARRGVYVSFITTPLNTLRVRPAIDRASRCSNLHLVELRFTLAYRKAPLR
ncbi:UDP-glycosyltransferase 73B4 [Acorus calamus]|uniref:UDP-glycosyltransferase 73B4 n=1 Tax=Acorus calamus TaxID=4465 RepID=A0AAV9E372_ACOCL|nr:UDP-glycosyltransferase 73B4 [Acorus calamus]